MPFKGLSQQKSSGTENTEQKRLVVRIDPVKRSEMKEFLLAMQEKYGSPSKGGISKRGRSQSNNLTTQNAIIDFENTIHGLVPERFLSLYNSKLKRCPACGTGARNRYELVKHWKMKHILEKPHYYCPVEECTYRTFDKNIFRNHLELKHPEFPIEDRLKKSVFERSRSYVKPRFFSPPTSTTTSKKRKSVTRVLREKRHPKSLNPTKTFFRKGIEVEGVPPIFFEHFKVGGGCPSVGCKAASCHFREDTLLNHWVAVHSRFKPQVKCPAASCKMYFKTRTTLRHHIEYSHPKISPRKAEEVCFDRAINKSYVEPVLPDTGKRKSVSAKRKRATINTKYLSPVPTKTSSTADSEDEFEDNTAESGAGAMSLDPEDHSDEANPSRKTRHGASMKENCAVKRNTRNTSDVSSSALSSLQAEFASITSKQNELEKKLHEEQPGKVDKSVIEEISKIKSMIQEEVHKKLSKVETDYLVIQAQNECMFTKLDLLAKAMERMEKCLKEMKEDAPSSKRVKNGQSENGLTGDGPSDEVPGPSSQIRPTQTCTIKLANGSNVEFEYINSKDFSEKLALLGICS